MNVETVVIGGGISGITTAVELADLGKTVILVEKEPYLGGNVAKLNNYFPKLCPPSCGLEINFRRIRSNPRVTCYTGAEASSIDGNEGAFRLSLRLAPRMINDHCTACGKCAEVCPVEQPLEPGYSKAKKSAYIKGGIQFPAKYTIDQQSCLREACGKCLEVCEYDAIDLAAKPSQIELEAKNVIVSTGWESYDPNLVKNYNYSSSPDVLSNMEFESFLAACSEEGKNLVKPSDGKTPDRIAFVQCAGSRDINHLPYCSAVCCAASVKHALSLSELYPEIKSEIFYIDLRLTGRNEKLLNKAEESTSITLTKGKVGRIEPNEKGIMVEVEDIMAGKKRQESFQMVVLATGMVPTKVLPDLALNDAGFLKGLQKRGIYPASSCKRPMDVSTSVKDATSAALKSMRDNNE